MKGPGLRANLDVRRLWQCPACARMARIPGTVTAHRCFCTSDGVWMRLIELPKPVRVMRERVIIPDDDDHEPEPVPAQDSAGPKPAAASLPAPQPDATPAPQAPVSTQVASSPPDQDTSSAEDEPEADFGAGLDLQGPASKHARSAPADAAPERPMAGGELAHDARVAPPDEPVSRHSAPEIGPGSD